MIPQLQRQTPVSAPEQKATWSLATRIGFRFAFSYLVLYLSPGAVGALGSEVQISNAYQRFWQQIWHAVVPWVGTHVLNINGDFREVINGSGDELYDYVLVLCIFLLAAFVTLVWSVLDRKRSNYRVLYQWFRMFMRLVVGAAMIGYGMNKLFPMQFPEPPLAALINPFARMSPMTLLWNFMGTSRLYSLFGGIGEMSGGLLLFVPRLTCLGSLISFGMLSNVFLLNLGYDVPRKIYSIHLLLMCVFLLLPDFGRLANVFIWNRRAEPAREVPLFADKQLNRAALVLQVVFGFVVLGIAGHDANTIAVREATHLPSTIRGIWAVEDFVLDGTSRPPLLTDTERWKNIIFDNPGLLTVQDMDETQHQYNLQFDPEGKFFTLGKTDDAGWNARFAFAEVHVDHLTLEGQFDGHSLTAKLRRVDLTDPSKFLLTNRGLHWINPFPLRR